jgi:hypothetical protein
LRFSIAFIILKGLSLPFFCNLFEPSCGHLGDLRAQSQEVGTILKALVSKVASRWLPMAPSNPRLFFGNLLGPSEAVLEGLGTPKTLKNNIILKVFAVVCFRYFGALDGSWAHLGSSCGELVPKWLPKWVPRWLQIEPRWAILAITGHSPMKPELF